MMWGKKRIGKKRWSGPLITWRKLKGKKDVDLAMDKVKKEVEDVD